MAGYSGTPLAAKLGIKEGMRVALLAAPHGFERTLEPLPPAVAIRRRARAPLDVALLFTTSRRDVERRFAGLAEKLEPAGGLWLCWPKGCSGVATDVSENVLREVCLPHGLVDNKVCAVDDVWSGLRFVWRKELRAERGRGG